MKNQEFIRFAYLHKYVFIGLSREDVGVLFIMIRNRCAIDIAIIIVFFSGNLLLINEIAVIYLFRIFAKRPFYWIIRGCIFHSIWINYTKRCNRLTYDNMKAFYSNKNTYAWKDINMRICNKYKSSLIFVQ